MTTPTLPPLDLGRTAPAAGATVARRGLRRADRHRRRGRPRAAIGWGADRLACWSSSWRRRSSSPGACRARPRSCSPAGRWSSAHGSRCVPARGCSHSSARRDRSARARRLGGPRRRAGAALLPRHRETPRPRCRTRGSLPVFVSRRCVRWSVARAAPPPDRRLARSRPHGPPSSAGASCSPCRSSSCSASCSARPTGCSPRSSSRP